MAKSSVEKKRSVKKPSLSPAGLVICLSILIFLLPLIYSTETNEPSIPTRWLFLALGISFVIVYSMLYKKQHLGWSQFSLSIRSFIGASALFWIWGLISSYTSVSPFVSLQEMLRLVPILILGYLAFAAQKLHPSSMKWIYRSIAISAGLQGIVTVGQGWGIDFLLEIPGKGGKLYGVMANGVLLGAAQALALPFVWIATMDKSKIWALVSKLSISFVVASIIVSASRSPWLAAFIGVLPILVVIIKKREHLQPYLRKTLKTGWFFAVLSIFLCGTVIMGTERVGREISARLIISSATADSSSNNRAAQAMANVTSRFEMWKVAYSKIGNHPILGIGPATWMIMSPVYEGSRRPNLRYYTKIIRPHNTYLQIANEYGIPGLLLFIALLAIPFFAAVRNIMNAKPRAALENAAMLGVLLALATDAMFSFPQERMVHPAYLALASGIILALEQFKVKPKSTSSQTMLWVFLLLTCFTSAYAALERWQFEYHWRYAKAYLDQGDYEKCLESSTLASSPIIKVGPMANTVEVSTAQALKNLGRYEEAEQQSYRGLSYHPNNFALLNNLGTIYFEQEQLDSAVHYYDKARALTPAEPLVLRNLAITYGKMEDFNNCIETIEKIPEGERTEGIKQWYLYSKQELRK